jgi:hypothetical protein
LSICGHWHWHWHWHRHRHGQGHGHGHPLIVWYSTMRQRDSTKKRGERVLWKWNCPREKSITKKDCTPIGWRYLIFGAGPVWEEWWWIVRGSFVLAFGLERRTRHWKSPRGLSTDLQSTARVLYCSVT